MIEKHFTIRTPSASTVGIFLRNAVAVLVVFLTIMGSVLYAKVNNEQAVAVHAAEQILASHCSFFKDLGDAPLVTTIVNGKPLPPSKLGVRIVMDSRAAYNGIGCVPKLVPNPSLIHWAQVYGIK